MPSARPSAYKGGSGILRDVDSTILDIQFTTENPLFTGPKTSQTKATGADGEPFKSLYAVLELQQDGAEKATLQPLFVGDSSLFAVNDDGRGVTDAIDNAAISKSSDFAIFMGSLVAAGFDEALLDNSDNPTIADFGPVVTARIRTNWQVNATKTKRLGQKKSKDGKKGYDREDLIVTNFYGFAEAAPAAAATTKPAARVAGRPGATTAPVTAAKAKNKAATAPVFDVASETTQAILLALDGAKDKTLSKNQLSVKLLNAFAAPYTADNRAEARTWATNNDNLAAIDGVTFDAATQKLTLDA